MKNKFKKALAGLLVVVTLTVASGLTLKGGAKIASIDPPIPPKMCSPL